MRPDAKEVASVMPQLRKWACKLTGHDEDARDLMQDTFVRAVRCDSYSPGHLTGWLRKVMRTTHLNNVRHSVDGKRRYCSRKSVSIDRLRALARMDRADGNDVEEWPVEIDEDLIDPFEEGTAEVEWDIERMMMEKARH